MTTSIVYTNNCPQTVLLPAENCLPEHVPRAEVRVLGQGRVISPAGATWDSFFQSDAPTTDGFMNERADQYQSAREDF
jgi:antitoxin VapB